MSVSKAKQKYIRSLKEKKFRNEHGVFVAEGYKIVSELLAVYPCKLLVATQDFIDNNKNIINVEELVVVSDDELTKVSFLQSPQQVLAIFVQPQDILSFDPDKELILVLDCVQDPGNMGTIMRLADWYGINHIVCSRDSADIYNPKTVQATMGAIARVRVHYTDLQELLSKYKDTPIYGTFLDGGNMYEQPLSPNGIIVMGNEGKGISPEIERWVTNKLFIPNYPPERATSESLNVAIATGIICAEFRRRSLLH